MNVRHSTATPINQYQLTIIESGLLLSRLAREIEFLKNELRRASAEFRKDPKYFTSHALHELSEHSRAAISKPHAIPASLISLFTIAAIITMVLLVDRARANPTSASENEPAQEFVM